MSLNKLIEYIGSSNIAADLSDERLHIISREVIERADIDSESMKGWMDAVKHGQELCKPEFEGRSDPWPNAANYKSTLLVEAANQFGNRAAVELMRDPNLVKASIIGAKTIKNSIDRKLSDINARKKEIEKIQGMLQQLQESGEQPDQKAQSLLQELTQKTAEDEQGIKDKKKELRNRNERADRVSEHMNWQINNKMREWRGEQKRLMYTLPSFGCLFKKTFFDKTSGRCVSRVVQYPDFIVNQRTTDLDTCRSFTHIMAFTKSEYDARVAQGIWLDVDLFKEAQTNEEGSNENAEVEATDDNPDRFYEQCCWADLDDDGIEEPYIVTLHVTSGKVLRIVARYDEDSLIVTSESYRPMSLLDAQKKAAARIDKINAEYNTSNEYADPDDLSEFELVRVEPVPILTKYGLIPSLDGSFLDVGYYHLIGSTTLGVNKTTNDLLNAGTLVNNQSGFIAKNFKKKPGNFAIKMGEFMQTECAPEVLQQSVFRMPYSEPSQTLYALNEKLEMSARGFFTNVDVGGQLQANTAPTTALAMIQESLVQQTAHNAMIADSMGCEFNIIYKLNRDYTDDDEYKEVVGDEEAVFAEDFNTDGLAIACSANPEMSSRSQRMMLAQAEMENVPYVIQAGGNAVPIIKNYYARIGSENTDEIFPNESEMTPEEKAQMDQMAQMQKVTMEAQQQQAQAIQLQTDLLKAAEERKDREAEIKAQETLAKINKILAEVEKLRADTIFSLEKAETEQVTNKIDMYTAASNELTKQEAAIAEKMNESTEESN